MHSKSELRRHAHGRPENLVKRIAELEAALLTAESALFNASSSAGVQSEVLKEAALAAYKIRDKQWGAL
jgi:hypothetical protein